jgi:hypothetical protein
MTTKIRRLAISNEPQPYPSAVLPRHAARNRLVAELQHQATRTGNRQFSLNSRSPIVGHDDTAVRLLLFVDDQTEVGFHQHFHLQSIV